MTALLETTQLSKTFTLHGRGGLALPVFSGIDLTVFAEKNDRYGCFC